MSVSTVDLAERARAVALIADEHAEFGDSHGRLADPVVEALHREGLFGMWVPRTVPGGAELDPVSSLQVIENVAYGDPSAGWVLMAAALAIGTQSFSVHFIRVPPARIYCKPNAYRVTS